MKRAAFLVAVVACVAASSPDRLRQPSAAMEPTVLVGDEFLVEPLAGTLLGKVVVLAVARGPNHEVYPASQRPDLKTEFDVKRVVAVGGDSIAVQGARLVRNGNVIEATNRDRAYTDINGRSGSLLAQRIGEQDFEILDTPDLDRDHDVSVVPESHVFVVGDNRDYSRDSRVFGSFPVADIVGQVGAIYASLNPVTQNLRPERVGKRVN